MKETELKIRIIGDPVLKWVAKPIAKITDEHRKILSRMAQLMYSVSGVGLAAPQIGIAESMIVVDAGSGLYKLANPKITKSKGAQISEEGCLSVPGVSIKVKRALYVVVQAFNEAGRPVIIEAEDLLACVFQHEIDHLHGKLIVDYLSMEEKQKINKGIKDL